MPRKTEIPEYNKPEQDYIRAHFTPEEIDSAVGHLCDNCIHQPCLILPLTTKGKYCPYFYEVQNGKSHE